MSQDERPQAHVPADWDDEMLELKKQHEQPLDPGFILQGHQALASSVYRMCLKQRW